MTDEEIMREVRELQSLLASNRAELAQAKADLRRIARPDAGNRSAVIRINIEALERDVEDLDKRLRMLAIAVTSNTNT